MQISTPTKHDTQLVKSVSQRLRVERWKGYSCVYAPVHFQTPESLPREENSEVTYDEDIEKQLKLGDGYSAPNSERHSRPFKNRKYSLASFSEQSSEDSGSS